MRLLVRIAPVFLLLLCSCKDKILLKYQANVPVYADFSSFRSSVKFTTPRPLTQSGQILTTGSYLLSIAPGKGIHFIQNTDPSHPVNTGFLQIPGCTGAAISGHYLYADSYIDLVVIDLENGDQPVEIARLKDVFPLALPATGNNLRTTPVDKSLGVVIGWKVQQVEEAIAQEPGWENCDACNALASGDEWLPPTSVGVKTGSVTRFGIIDAHLYVLDQNRLIPFSVTDPLNVTAAQAIKITTPTETLFVNDHYLFIGTTTGMVVYGTDNPDVPQQISVITHPTACDNVIVYQHYAYVTTRSGTTCAGAGNRLDVIRIDDIAQPEIVRSVTLTNPHGLGAYGNLLFICDGTDGLKILDITSPASAQVIPDATFPPIDATDVIPLAQTLIVTGRDGIYQYDYSDPQHLSQLSFIPIQP